MENSDEQYLFEAVMLSRQGMAQGHGGPFGCVIVKDGKVVGQGYNRVTSTNDPTAHAEVVAIRDACARLGSFQLEGCVVYTSCEPCPMCMGAIYWARPLKVIYANTRGDAAAVGFDDQFIYDELKIEDLTKRKIPFVHIALKEAKEVFETWKAQIGRIEY